MKNNVIKFDKNRKIKRKGTNIFISIDNMIDERELDKIFESIEIALRVDKCKNFFIKQKPTLKIVPKDTSTTREK